MFAADYCLIGEHLGFAEPKSGEGISPETVFETAANRIGMPKPAARATIRASRGRTAL